MPTKKKRLTAPTWSIPQQYTQGIQVGGQGGVAGPYTKEAGLAAMNARPISSPIGGFANPNWAALIGGDPDWISAQSEMNRMNQADRSSLRNQIRRAVIESGLNVGLDEDIDQATLNAAAANQYSSAADIAGQLRRGAAQSDAELAARGILSSGQFTENRGQLQKSADLARNNLQTSLLDTIAQGRNAYASAVAGRQEGLINLRAQIAARLAQNPGIWQVMDTPAAAANPVAQAFAAPRPAAAVAAPQQRFAEGTIDGAGNVFRNGRWQPIGGGARQPAWLRALNVRGAAMNRRY